MREGGGGRREGGTCLLPSPPPSLMHACVRALESNVRGCPFLPGEDER